MKKKLLNIINSYKVIIIVLMLLCVFLLMYLNKITSTNKIYLFEGSSDYVEVKSGVVSLNYNMNLFQGSNIEFKEKDKTVVSYDIGYYVLVNDEYLPLATKAGEDDEGLSLKELITGTDNYKIIEPANGNYFFTKDKINNLDTSYYFNDMIDKNVDISEQLDGSREYLKTKDGIFDYDKLDKILKDKYILKTCEHDFGIPLL